VRLAKRHGVVLRQSYARVGKIALIKQANKALRKLQTYLGPQAASALSRQLFSARWNQKQSSLEGF
jgi:hypothetical protein